MRILSVMKYNNYYTVFYETDSNYIREDIFLENTAITKYPKKQFGDYDQFVNTMKEAYAGTRFLLEPVEIDEINYDDIKRLYDQLSIQFGWQ